MRDNPLNPNVAMVKETGSPSSKSPALRQETP
jgi:hypothetical protein